MPDTMFRHVVTPEHFIAVRNLPGGPAPDAMADSLAIYTAREADTRRLVEEGRARGVRARQLLASEIARLTQAAKKTGKA